MFSSSDIKNKYLLPTFFHQKKVDETLLKQLNMFESHKEISLDKWENLGELIDNSTFQTVTVGMITKYNKGVDNYLSLEEALIHASWELRVNLKINHIDSEDYTQEELEECDCILIPGGYGIRGTEGKKMVTKFARTKNIPFLGICLGFQIAVIEFGENVLGLEDCNSTEFDP